MSDSRPIGVLDSGVGGLSVLREIRRQLPAEHLQFFADQAHLPYGPRSLLQVRAFTEAISRFLIEGGAKVIVVACNTASAAALYHLRDVFPGVPFVGMEPAVKPAARETTSGVVGIMATPATFQGDHFTNLIQRYGQDVRVLRSVCPGLVERVEAGALEDAETVALLNRFLTPLLSEGMDTMVLGCTHYPFLIPAIRRLVGPKIRIIDPSPAVARQVRHVLAGREWLRLADELGDLDFFTSGDPGIFHRQVTRLFSDPGEVLPVKWVGSSDALRIQSSDSPPQMRE